MTLRWTIHAIAGLAAIILVASTSSVKSSPGEIVRALALLVVVVYLVYVLCTILADFGRRQPVEHFDLWDPEIDSRDKWDDDEPGRLAEVEGTVGQSRADPD